MPIEIKELVIKMNVSERLTERKNVQAELPPDFRSKIVKECVERVIEKLKSKIER